jgi:flagellar biosynthesis protein
MQARPEPSAGDEFPVPSRAAVLSYEPGAGPPKVVAKGRGDLAHRIVAAAQAAGLPVHRSPELVSLLMQVDVDRHVPEALYRAVAEVLVWAHEMSPERLGRKIGEARNG